MQAEVPVASLKPADVSVTALFRFSAARERWNEVMLPPWQAASALELGGIACDFGGVFGRFGRFGRLRGRQGFLVARRSISEVDCDYHPECGCRGRCWIGDGGNH